MERKCGIAFQSDHRTKKTFLSVSRITSSLTNLDKIEKYLSVLTVPFSIITQTG